MAQITTRFIGSGVYQDGTAIAWPVNPWVVYDGEYTRPVTKKFRIVNQALYELDGTTPAKLPPSYVPEGVSGPVVYPSGCYYGFEIFQGGRRAYKGFLQVPYDPLDAGVIWFDFKLAPTTIGYPSQRDATDGVKTYANSTARDADQANILKGTIVLVLDEAVFYGRTSSGWVPLYDSSLIGSVYEAIHFGDASTYQSPVSASSSDGFQFSDTTDGSSDTLTQETVTDGFRFADAAIADSDFVKTLTEGILFGDTPAALGTNEAAVSDGFLLSDVTAVDDQTRLAEDGLVFSEDLTVITTESFDLETIEFGDIVLGVGPGDAQQGVLSDTVLWGDSAAPTGSYTLSDGVILGDETSSVSPDGSIASDGIIFGIDTIDTVITIDFDSDGLVFSETMATVTVETFDAEGLSFGDTTDGTIT